MTTLLARQRSYEGGTECVEIVTVTPGQAREWLSTSRGNRNLRVAKVNQYARSMSAGEFTLSSMIIFGADGRLIDGHHRLQACVESGVPFRAVALSGATGGTVATVDTGTSRTFADYLKIVRGEKNWNLLAATVRLAYQYDEGAVMRAASAAPSHQELIRWLNDNPKVRASVRHGDRAYKTLGRGRMPAAVLSMVHYQSSKTAPSATDQFFTLLITGADLEENSPILALRRWMDRVAASPRKPATGDSAATLIKALNAFREGRESKLIVWKRATEAFPTITDVDVWYYGD